MEYINMYIYIYIFRLIEGFKDYGAKALSVSVGKRHTLIQTTDGEILSCGVGEYG
jgi:alpha-tubulin suppressor-like RCC1 family protein